ncbi:MAG TPA: zinc dependent phospholipase C family protein [Candidatus Eisenbacteria bacterium]|nr:zinc dependent phospholipase C family protein [Candidatus Eisenbacteria bacterium]
MRQLRPDFKFAGILRRLVAAACASTLILVCPEPGKAYSVMSHQAIIDAAWEDDLKPALRKRFPRATEEGLNEGQAYAYGGAIIQDLGYYPYGNPFFSDLTHYVRSADFILALLRDAQDVNEYAFALGAMAHYAADNNGHKVGTNRAVPILYPKLKKKYGDSVSFEEDKLAHVKTEFGFDVLEVAKERYAPESYHDFIGFEISRRVLEEAFEETYGLDLKEVLVNEDRALNSYRHAVSNLLPRATRIAWHLKRDEIEADQPGITKRKFLYNVNRAKYELEWGKDYQRPTLGDKWLAFLYKILPKFGPLRVLQFKTPTADTEHMFEASFNDTLDEYRKLLRQQRETQQPALINENFDLGTASAPGQYQLSDAAHAKLLDRLAHQSFAGMTAEIRAELLGFFGATGTPFKLKKDKKAWAKLQTQLEALRKLPSNETVAAVPATEN